MRYAICDMQAAHVGRPCTHAHLGVADWVTDRCRKFLAVYGGSDRTFFLVVCTVAFFFPLLTVADRFSALTITNRVFAIYQILLGWKTYTPE